MRRLLSHRNIACLLLLVILSAGCAETHMEGNGTNSANDTSKILPDSAAAAIDTTKLTDTVAVLMPQSPGDSLKQSGRKSGSNPPPVTYHEVVKHGTPDDVQLDSMKKMKAKTKSRK